MPDVGLTGSPAAVQAALAASGFQVNADGSLAVVDPTLNTAGLTVAGYRVLDGAAYVLVRSPGGIPVPAGLTVLGVGVTMAISGAFMPDTSGSPPTVIPAGQFFQRFTQAEKTAMRAALAGRPALAAAIVGAALSDGVDLAAPGTSTVLDLMVTAGALTAARKATVLVP